MTFIWSMLALKAPAVSFLLLLNVDFVSNLEYVKQKNESGNLYIEYVLNDMI